MIAITILIAVPILFVLMVIFGLTYKIRGLKVSIIATGAAFVLFAMLYMGIIFVMVNSMGN